MVLQSGDGRFGTPLDAVCRVVYRLRVVGAETHASDGLASPPVSRSRLRLVVLHVYDPPPPAPLTAVHAYTAAVIQYMVLRRVPTCMIADDVRADFQASYETIEQMAPNSAVARRALPMLNRLRDRLSSTEQTPNGGMERLLQTLLGGEHGAPPHHGVDAPSSMEPMAFDPSLMDGLGLAFEPLPSFTPSLDPMQMSAIDPLIQTL